MGKRTSPKDAEQIEEAADLELIVQDKRVPWRATDAKARRRQRRYKKLLTQEILKLGVSGASEHPDDDQTDENDTDHQHQPDGE